MRTPTAGRQYRVVLTEGTATTATEPLDRAAAMAAFNDDVAGPGLCPVRWDGRLRVLTEAEYQRLGGEDIDELRRTPAVPLVDGPGRSPARGNAALAALHQALGRVWDRLAETTDPHRRAPLFIDAADLQHDLAYLYGRYATEATPYQDGHTIAAAHVSTGQLFDALADVEFIVGGLLTRRHATATSFEAAAGAILDRMAATPDVTARALLLAELHAAVEPVIGEWAAEDLQGLPYAPGMTGWEHDEPRPRTVSLRAIVRAWWRRIRGTR